MDKVSPEHALTPSTIYEIPRPFEWPTVGKLRAVQRKHMTGPRDGKMHKNPRGLLVDKNNRVYIPKEAEETKLRLCIIAHCGLAGDPETPWKRRVG